jgi:type III restriction enzyme
VIDGTVPKVDIAKVVAETTDQYVELTIDIPRIVVVPKGEVSCGFNDFNLSTSGINLQPVSEDILIQLLRTHEREKLNDGSGIAKEDRLENYIVRALIDFDDISYDNHAELLYKLSGQLVVHLQSYLQDVEDVKNVLQYNQKRLADLIHAQMQDHYWEKATSYEAQVSKGFSALRDNSYSALTREAPRDFRLPVEDRRNISGMVFGGFKKCCYSTQKFDSDTERKFTVILEDNGNSVLKWFKPGKEQFKIYSHKDQSYEPDFVVETTTGKFLCETKAANEIDTPDVQAKKKAAVEWCKYASEHEIKHGGKPWSYVLIPHDGVSENNTFSGIASTYTQL